ncbi:MAG: 30S ribosomal protein S18 [Magnetococcales bacterium]|nr:30S ribosomal protein S18 [Magnetococcales bacterium]NGZ26934.1 30S ribosomal protein S18 [Magnetococcales bacterium]
MSESEGSGRKEMGEGRGRGKGGRGGRGGEEGMGGGGRRPFARRRKVCLFCADKGAIIDYKDPKLLRRFITERGKIVPSRITGVCSPHQRALSTAIKRARSIALLPFLVS